MFTLISNLTVAFTMPRAIEPRTPAQRLRQRLPEKSMAGDFAKMAVFRPWLWLWTMSTMAVGMHVFVLTCITLGLHVALCIRNY